MRTRRNSKLILINLLVYILFLLPAGRLDLYKENYSTLSLYTKGYLFLLFLGIITGALMGYETYKISGKRNGIILLVSMVLGTCVPHEVPYHLRGNLHLLFAYTGGFVLICMTYINLMRKYKKYLKEIFGFVLLLCFLIYMRYMMVNTLIEVLLMSVCMFINFTLAA